MIVTHMLAVTNIAPHVILIKLLLIVQPFFIKLTFLEEADSNLKEAPFDPMVACFSFS